MNKSVNEVLKKIEKILNVTIKVIKSGPQDNISIVNMRRDFTENELISVGETLIKNGFKPQLNNLLEDDILYVEMNDVLVGITDSGEIYIQEEI